MERAQLLCGDRAEDNHASDASQIIALDVAFDFSRLHETEPSPPSIVFRIVDVREKRAGVAEALTQHSTSAG